MKKILLVLFAALIVATTLQTIHEVNTSNTKLRLQELKLRNVHSELDKLEQDYNNLDKAKAEEVERLKQREAELERQLQAKRLLKEQEAKTYAATVRNTPTGPLNGCGDNAYAHYIYMKESGCRTTALNSIGCYGIGQSCPASKIAHCGADYACQNAWFSNYAISRYGSWEKAYYFWLENRWW